MKARRLRLFDDAMLGEVTRQQAHDLSEMARKQLDKVDAILEKEYNIEKIVRTTPKKRKAIDDYGEEIIGARKDYFKNIAKEYSAITVQSLIELPLAKSVKLPPLEKMVEEGVLTEDEATFIFTIYCTIKKKPIGKSYSQKRLVQQWANDTFKRVLMIKSLMTDDKNDRERLIEQYKRPSEEKQNALNERVKDLRKWNPGDENSFAENEVVNGFAVIYDVLKKYGYKPGDKIDVPFSEIDTTPYVNRAKYLAYGNDFIEDYRYSSRAIAYADSVEELENKLLVLLSFSNPDESMQIPINMFTVHGNERVYKELDTYKGYIGVWHYPHWQQLTELFVHVTEAFLEDKKEEYKRLHPKKLGVEIVSSKEKEFIGYKSFAIRLNVLNKTYEIVIDATTEDEARAYIEDHYDEVNKRFVDEIFKSKTKGKKSPEDNFFVTRSWNRDTKKFEYEVVYKVARNFVQPIAKFDTQKEAEDYLAKNAISILAKIKNLNGELDKVFFETKGRKNKDWRKGEDIDEKAFCDEFGFRGIQFGNWTNMDDRQAALNECYDALCDLADVINWPRKAISLNGELGLAFGARGSGWANAHYECLQVVINLTKTRGAGCLGHEWWHALDNYFERLNGNPSLLLTNVIDSKRTDNIRPIIVSKYGQIVRAVRDSDYRRRSEEKGMGYWGSMCEMTARMFQVYLWKKMSEKDESSPFLERGGYAKLQEKYYRSNYELLKSISEDFKMSYEEYVNMNPSKMIYPYVYPTENEIKQFDPLIDELFKTIKIEEKEGKMFLSGFPENSLDVTDDTRKNDVISAISNIQNYNRGQYYLNTDQSTEVVSNALCRMMYMRGENKGYYTIGGEDVSVSIGCSDKKKSEVTITIERESGKESYKYKFPDSGNTKSFVVNAIINGFLSLFETGAYIDNSGLYTK